MRHRNTGRKFGRTSSHRKALMMNLCNALIEHEMIKTTLAKAKELRRFVEPMITVAKVDSLAGRRLMFSRLRSRDSVTKLFVDLGPRFTARPGGYVRVLKCGNRVGDNAPMAIVEMVERATEVKTPASKAKGKTVDVEPVAVKETKSKAEPKVKSEASKEKVSEAKAAPKKPKAKDESNAKAATGTKAKPKVKKADKE
jgi:large subunit ribosomal protein L17